MILLCLLRLPSRRTFLRTIAKLSFSQSRACVCMRVHACIDVIVKHPALPPCVVDGIIDSIIIIIIIL